MFCIDSGVLEADDFWRYPGAQESRQGLAQPVVSGLWRSAHGDLGVSFY